MPLVCPRFSRVSFLPLRSFQIGTVPEIQLDFPEIISTPLSEFNSPELDKKSSLHQLENHRYIVLFITTIPYHLTSFCIQLKGIMRSREIL
jgi:hypothetical protein